MSMDVTLPVLELAVVLVLARRWKALLKHRACIAMEQIIDFRNTLRYLRDSYLPTELLVW